MADQPFDKVIMCMNHGSNHPHQQKQCQFELKEKEMEQNEGRQSDFLDPIIPGYRAVWL